MVSPWFAPYNARWTVGDDLTWCQLVLRDDEGFITRDELLDYYQDGYRQLCALAQSTRQWRVLDLPPRATVTYIYPWERGAASTWDGQARQMGYQGQNGSTYTYAWELESALGYAVTDGAAICCTQLWEYAYLPDDGTTDQYYALAFHRSHERIAQVYWDNKYLAHKSVTELDSTDTAWWREQGELFTWGHAPAKPRQMLVYQIRTGYQQGYELYRAETASSARLDNVGLALGTLRELSGDRTYTATSDDSTYPYGLCRELSSTARDYVAQPTWSLALGTIRELRSSDANILVWEVIIPDHPMVQESMTPDLIPPQIQKYVRAYVLARAFSRQGELYNEAMAAWFEFLWQRGLGLLKKLGWVTRRDRGYQRQGIGITRREVPRPRLPSTFPRYIGV